MSIGFLLFFLLFLIIGVGLLGGALYNWRAARRTAKWPTVTGRVLDCTLEEDSSGDGTNYLVKLTYAYTVDGRQFEARELSVDYGGSGRRHCHELILTKLRSARTVQVHYDPARPEHAVLSTVVTRITVVLFLFGAIWTMMTLGMAALALGGGALLFGTMSVIFTLGFFAIVFLTATPDKRLLESLKVT
jgi:hypothetical protein